MSSFTSQRPIDRSDCTLALTNFVLLYKVATINPMDVYS